MAEKKQYKSVYFVGAGGIGMAALVRYYLSKGLKVAGYDRTRTALTDELTAEGAEITYDDAAELIPGYCRDKATTLVVYTPAVPSTHPGLTYFRDGGFDVMKRAQVLGLLTHDSKGLCFSGTHGKTTTSSMAAHILHSSEIGCNAFLGGILRNYDSNFMLSPTSPYTVIEADEFDRSFLQLHPAIAAITSMDADHLDIYGTLQEYRKAFKAFASQVSRTLIVKQGLDITPEDTKARILHYSYDDPAADYHAVNPRPDEVGHYIFDLVYPGGTIGGIRVGIPGWINVENSVAAAAVCLNHGVAPEAIKEAIGTYSGVKRRLDAHINTPHLSYIDDYAHHPKELASAISSLRGMFPGRKITAIFQPHLFTRTRDFADDFAQALSKVDKLILLDIYPAREEPIPGVTSGLIFDKVTCPDKVLLKKEELMAYLENEPVDVLVTFGAGNIDRFIAPVTELLKKRL